MVVVFLVHPCCSHLYKIDPRLALLSPTSCTFDKVKQRNYEVKIADDRLELCFKIVRVIFWSNFAAGQKATRV